MLLRRLAAFGLALAIAIGLAGRLEAAEVTLRLGAINAAATRSYTDFLVPLKKAIEDQSDGRIEIQLGAMNVFGKPGELLGMVESGKLDIASTAPAYHGDRFQRVSVFDLPLLFDTAEQGGYASWQIYKEGGFGPEFKGLKLLCMFPVPPYGVMTSQPVKTLHDLRGLRMRTSSLTAGQSLGRLAVIPLGLTPDAMGSSLKQGLIDGISYSLDAAMSTPGDGGQPLIEQLKYLVDVNMAGGTTAMVMRQDTFDALPADLREIIERNTGGELSLAGARLRDQWEADARKTLLAQGNHVFVTLTADEQTEIRRRVQPVIDNWIENAASQGFDGKALLERVRAIVREHPAK
jgi:TRAP-type C4-dicarboxylate transport system substrate-binding protein